MSTTETRLKADLSNWDPEDEATWNSRLAWSTLWITTYALTLGFASWFVVSAVAPRLNEVGFDLTPEQLYWLAALPGLAAGLLRLVFMFLPPILGSRMLVALGSALLALPLIGWTLVVQDSSTPYWVLLALAFSAGIGGGIFSGFMASTSYYFPKRLAGTALGLQAGIGNFGIAVMQFLVPWVIGFGLLGTAALTPQSTKTGEALWLHNGGLVLVPWVILAVVLAVVLIRSVPVKANFREQFDIFGMKHTWIMTAIYVMSFGVYSGLAAQLGLIIKNLYSVEQFGADAPNPMSYAFIGPALGALTRTIAGPLCDRYGGGRFTLIGGIGMTAGLIVTLFFLQPSGLGEFWGFLSGMLAVFFFAGFANAGTFKQMPMIFPRRQAGGAIGWTAAIAAFGPFFIGVGISSFGALPLFAGATVFCLFCTWLTWHYYVRPRAEKPS